MPDKWILTRTDGPRFVAVCASGAISDGGVKRSDLTCPLLQIPRLKQLLGGRLDFDITANLGSLARQARFSPTHAQPYTLSIY